MTEKLKILIFNCPSVKKPQIKILKSLKSEQMGTILFFSLPLQLLFSSSQIFIFLFLLSLFLFSTHYLLLSSSTRVDIFSPSLLLYLFNDLFKLFSLLGSGKFNIKVRFFLFLLFSCFFFSFFVINNCINFVRKFFYFFHYQ